MQVGSEWEGSLVESAAGWDHAAVEVEERWLLRPTVTGKIVKSTAKAWLRLVAALLLLESCAVAGAALALALARELVLAVVALIETQGPALAVVVLAVARVPEPAVLNSSLSQSCSRW